MAKLSATKCEICGFVPKAGNHIGHHVLNVHGMHMAEYRLRFNLAKNTTQKYENTLTTVKCEICGSEERKIPTWQFEMYKRNRVTRYSCEKPECRRELKSRRIHEARSTAESRAKSAAATKSRWDKDPAKMKTALKQGMSSSEKYAHRSETMKEHYRQLKLRDPHAPSRSLYKAWKSRPRAVLTEVNFKCDNCPTLVHRILKPHEYKQFLKIDTHFCSIKCQHEYRSAHVEMVTVPCAGCDGTRIMPKSLYTWYINYGQTKFFCTSKCQRAHHADKFYQGRDTYWKQNPDWEPPNKKYTQADGLVTCSICGQTRQLVPAYVMGCRRHGQKEFACDNKEHQDILRRRKLMGYMTTEKWKTQKRCDTAPERTIAAYLTEQGIPFVPQFCIRFRKEFKWHHWTLVDFLVGEKLIVYADGCFFHACPACEYKGLRPGIREMDAAITEELRAMGYTVVRIWEHELQSSEWKTRVQSALWDARVATRLYA